MAETKRADVLKYLENANMMEISDLIGEIEEKFGVSAAAPVAAVAAAPVADGGGPCGASGPAPSRYRTAPILCTTIATV